MELRFKIFSTDFEFIGLFYAGQIEQGKTKWIEKHLTPNPTKIIYEPNKEKYAHPSAIIIDDRSKVIDPWIAAGGIGILHVDGRLDNTIAQLDKYLQ